MGKLRHKNIHWKYLAIILSAFVVGTAIDIAMLNFFKFAIGGLGATCAMVVAIVLMYKYTNERVSLKSLTSMLRLARPHFPTIWDKIFVAVSTIGVVIYLILSVGVSFSIPSGALLMYALSAALIPPAIEELANRGFIQTSLERLGYSAWWVVGISTLIFALSHYPVNPTVIPSCFVMGVVFGILTMRTKSVFIPFLLHGLWNFIVVAFS